MAEAMVADHELMKREFFFTDLTLWGKALLRHYLINQEAVDKSFMQKLHGIATHTNVHISELPRN